MALAVQKTLGFFLNAPPQPPKPQTIIVAPQPTPVPEAKVEILKVEVPKVEVPKVEVPTPAAFAWEDIRLPGTFPVGLGSVEADNIIVKPVEQFNPRNIPFDIQGDPNEQLWKEIVEGKVDREKIFQEYRSLGQTVKIEGDRGIPDLNIKRKLNLQQHFTPAPVTQLIAKILGLDNTRAKVSVIDPACGIGGMFQFISPSCRIGGIEIEEKAYHMVRALFPEANIINDDIIHHPADVKADFVILNPPFSIQLEKKNCGFQNAGWGNLGPGSSIRSHIAAMEAAIRGARYYVAAFLPTSYFTNEDTLTFERWVNERAELIYRLDITEGAFTKYGFTWPCSVVVYKISSCNNYKLVHHTALTLSWETHLKTTLEIWKDSQAWKDLQDLLTFLENRHHEVDIQLRKYVPERIPPSRITIPLTGKHEARLCLSPDASCINIQTSNLLDTLKIHQIKHNMGRQWNEGLREYTQLSDVRLRRNHLLQEFSDITLIQSDIEAANIKTIMDPQVLKWRNRKLRWLERQMAPFEQYILKDGTWICLHEKDGIKSLYRQLYWKQLEKMDKLGITWLWDFQREDVARMSLKDSNLMCWEMGLGKTRGIIALALLYGVKHSLIIVEPKLKSEFMKEFKNLHIEDVQVIEKESDLKSLKKFNIIAYNLLWRPLNAGTKRTFSKAMRRRFQFIAVDEAHKIKAQDSQQAKAVRMLKSRYKLLSTGTPIANYPRNIFSLLVWGWGDATELNPYGYHGPIPKTDDDGYCHGGFTTGTRQFKTDFVTIEWVSPQFEQTLDKGAKAREVPKIKDPEKWWKMLGNKIVRRQREEPDVKKHVTFPKPEIIQEMLRMHDDQIKHYKYWLDNFAKWFKEQLRMEKEEGHKIDQMMVLAHLTQLQFASTIPQSPKTNTKDAPYNTGTTSKQIRAIQLVRKAVLAEEKVIVFSERPEFSRLLKDELDAMKIKAHLFIGQQGIKERNLLLDDFRNNGTHVLLATTTCGETGLNIPEANVVIIADTSWTPSKQIQAYSRILRPQQKKKPRIYLLRAKGTIDEYMQQLMDAKSEAINEGIDYQQAAEFDPEKWLSYRDFTIKMLKEEGYEV